MYEVYGADWCPYCHKAVEELKQYASQEVPIKSIHSIPEAYQMELDAQRHTTIPAIFENGRFVGGLAELRKELSATPPPKRAAPPPKRARQRG